MTGRLHPINSEQSFSSWLGSFITRLMHASFSIRKSREASFWLGSAILWSTSHCWALQAFFPTFACFCVDFVEIVFYSRKVLKSKYFHGQEIKKTRRYKGLGGAHGRESIASLENWSWAEEAITTAGRD